MKVQLSLDDNLMARVDNFVDDNYMSRSAFFTAAATQYLGQFEILALIKQMSFVIDKIDKTGKLDDESQKQLDDFQQLVSLLGVGKL